MTEKEPPTRLPEPQEAAAKVFPKAVDYLFPDRYSSTEQIEDSLEGIRDEDMGRAVYRFGDDSYQGFDMRIIKQKLRGKSRVVSEGNYVVMDKNVLEARSDNLVVLTSRSSSQTVYRIRLISRQASQQKYYLFLPRTIEDVVSTQSLIADGLHQFINAADDEMRESSSLLKELSIQREVKREEEIIQAREALESLKRTLSREGDGRR